MFKFLKFLPFYLLSLLPLRLLFLLSNLTSWFLHHVLKYRREIIRKNLSRSFPELSNDQLFEIEKKYYLHFCDMYFEALKSLTISPSQLRNHISLANPSVIASLEHEKRSIILYAAHYGNWEWFNAAPLLLSYRCSTFYKKLTNSYFNELIQLIRGRFGVKLFEHNKGYKSLVDIRSEDVLDMCYMIGDQTPRGKTTKYWTRFLNQPTAFFVGPDRIARKLDYAIVFPVFHKVKRGKYELEFKLLAKEPGMYKGEEVIDAFISELESVIKSAPEMWLWSHKRWRLKVPEKML